MKDLLEWMGGCDCHIHLGSAVFGIVTHLSALEASPLSHAFCMFLGGKLFEFDYVDVHSVRIMGGSRSRGSLGSEARVAQSSSQLIDAQFLAMEEFGFLDPSLEVIRQECHGQDHGGNLPIESSGELGYSGECYASQQTNIKVKILTLREVLMKRHCVLKVRQ